MTLFPQTLSPTEVPLAVSFAPSLTQFSIAVLVVLCGVGTLLVQSAIAAIYSRSAMKRRRGRFGLLMLQMIAAIVFVAAFAGLAILRFGNVASAGGLALFSGTNVVTYSWSTLLGATLGTAILFGVLATLAKAEATRHVAAAREDHGTASSTPSTPRSRRTGIIAAVCSAVVLIGTLSVGRSQLETSSPGVAMSFEITDRSEPLWTTTTDGSSIRLLSDVRDRIDATAAHAVRTGEPVRDVLRHDGPPTDARSQRAPSHVPYGTLPLQHLPTQREPVRGPHARMLAVPARPVPLPAADEEPATSDHLADAMFRAAESLRSGDRFPSDHIVPITSGRFATPEEAVLDAVSELSGEPPDLRAVDDAADVFAIECSPLQIGDRPPIPMYEAGLVVDRQRLDARMDEIAAVTALPNRSLAVAMILAGITLVFGAAAGREDATRF